MSLTWKLARTNVPDQRTLNAWGIREATLNRVNSGRDTLVLGFGRVDLAGNLPFDPDESIVLLRDGAPYFRGRVTGESRGAFGSAEGVTLTLSGPWWYLEKIIFQQPAGFVLEPTANPDPEDEDGLQITDFELVTKYTSRVRTGLDGEGNRINVRDQITAILNYAISKGAPIAIGTIDPVLAGPRQEFRDTNCAELIIKLLTFTPGNSIFWDFTVNPPAIHIRSRANRPLFTLDLADGTNAQVQLNPRRDLVVSGVTVNYQRLHRRPNFQFYTLSKETAGPNPDGIGALVITLGVNGTYYIEGEEDEIVPQEDAPIGIAAAIYNEYSIAPFEGRAVLILPEADQLSWLARTFRVLNGATAWETATMVIQQSSEDLFPLEHSTGTFFRTELTIGPPNQLGPTNLTTRLGGSVTTPPDNENIPTTPPVPGNFPPHTPPPPPTPPYDDFDPANWASPRNGYALSVHVDTRNDNCGGAGHPACPLLTANTLSYYDAPSDFPFIVANQGSFGASLGHDKGRSYSTATEAGYDFHIIEDQNFNGAYSEWTFDFTTLSSLNCVALKLLGTKTLSKADGDSVTTPIELDLTGSIGSMITVRAATTIGAEFFNSFITRWAKGGSVGYPTLRIFRPPGSV